MTTDKPTAQEIAGILAESQVVTMIWPDGGRHMLKGEATLKAIVASGKSRTLRVSHLPVTRTQEAEVIAAANTLIEAGNMGVAQLATFQQMLDHVRSLH